MNRAIMTPLAVLLVLTAIVGCGVKKPFEGRHDPYPPGQISIASQMLQDNTAVGTPTASRDEAGNILFVTVPIRSTRNEQMYVDYRVTFFDKNGQQLSQSAWLTKTLTPNVHDSIQVNSMSARAADFHVDFREAR